jgi:hypothetical protein
VTLKSIGLFLISDAGAIREVAREKASLFAGIVLVLSAGIAREYDQTYFFAEPHKYFEPLIISFFSCLIIYIFVAPLNRASVPENPDRPSGAPAPQSWIEFPQFLALFWMTAPIAWLYALPVERFLSPADAAKANIALLCIVAGWRVILMSRVISVLSKSSFSRALCSVLIPAAGLVFLASVGTSLSLIRLMGGMQYSPEETVIARAAEFGFGASLIVGFVTLIALATIKRSSEPGEPEAQVNGRFAVLELLIILVIWTGLAVYSQPKLAMSFEARRLLRDDPKALLAFLSQHSLKDFSPSHRLPPDPYGYAAFEELPQLFEAMDGSEAPWVRDHYLKYLKILLGQDSFYYQSFHRLAGVAKGLEQIPEGRKWALEHAAMLRQAIAKCMDRDYGPKKDLKDLTESLKRLGVLDDDTIIKLHSPEKEPAPSRSD